MKDNSYKKTIITNCIIVLLLCFTFLASFTNNETVPIYNNTENSAIYNGDRNSKNVSLMFNVYENTEIVNKIINVLNENNAKATFFVGGCWADDNKETLERMVSSGHEIANHGYFHKDHKALSYDKNYEEIFLTDKVVYALCGVKPTLFAPPSGSFSNETLKSAYDLNYKVIMWSKDTIDWRDKDAKKVYNRATNNILGGDLILMHPKEHTLLALNDILGYYRIRGYNVVTVSENIGV